MNFSNNLVLIVTAIMAAITFIVSYRVLAKTVLGGIFVPLAVAGLAFLGLWTMARGWIEFILVEYATLALALLAVLVLAFFFRKTTSKGNTADSCRKPWTPFKGKW